MVNSPHQIQQTGGLLNCICWFWRRILDLALILWVTRVPLTITALGYLILAVAPQAQDLFVELASILAIAPQADDPFFELARAYGRVLLFLALLFFIWAMPTHYSARLLLDTDGRFQAFAPARPDAAATAFLRIIECWTPRVLGLATFVAVLIALWRSYANLPILDEPEVTAAIGAHLLNIGELVVVAAALFLGYTIKRPREADSFGLGYLKSLNRTLEPIWRHISPTGARPADRISEPNAISRQFFAWTRAEPIRSSQWPHPIRVSRRLYSSGQATIARGHQSCNRGPLVPAPADRRIRRRRGGTSG